MFRWVVYHRTKIGLVLFAGLPASIVMYGYRGPEADREFVMQCMMVAGTIYLAAIILGDVARCPHCRADLGYFYGIGPFRRARQLYPRAIACRNCGKEIER